jgi:hypothetical protein
MAEWQTTFESQDGLIGDPDQSQGPLFHREAMLMAVRVVGLGALRPPTRPNGFSHRSETQSGTHRRGVLMICGQATLFAQPTRMTRRPRPIRKAHVRRDRTGPAFGALPLHSLSMLCPVART